VSDSSPDAVGGSLADACHDAVIRPPGSAGGRVPLSHGVITQRRAPVRVRPLAKCAVLPRIVPSETIEPLPRV
jgi:hypothetical protein